MLGLPARPPAAYRGLSSLRLSFASAQSSWPLWSHCRRCLSSKPEEVHNVAAQEDKLDRYIDGLARKLSRQDLVSISDLYAQYSHDAGVVLNRVVPYEEQPQASKQAHARSHSLDESRGDGIVLLVHAQLDADGTHLVKTTICSGFVVDASINSDKQGDTIVTCAHTLEEMHRYLRGDHDNARGLSFSFIIPSTGPPRLITKLLSSMPRSDVIVLEAAPIAPTGRLRPLPMSPFPVYPGTPILTHLFGSPSPPAIKHSIARTKAATRLHNATEMEAPIPWLEGHAWRRWGAGMMLGYRSYTGLELEAGVSSVLPHILTSILPTPGSSGGPLVHAETGTVVGMTSGRRMDNRVEGERGWGCSAESIFEMFSLPGFTPSTQQKHPYP